MIPLYRYQTRNADKGLAIFAALTEAKFPAQLTNIICAEHGFEGMLIDTRCTEEQFATVRATLTQFPSTSDGVVPDHMPDSWT